MRLPVIRFRILTLMLFTAIVAVMAAMNLFLTPREWFIFFAHAIYDAGRGGAVCGLAVGLVLAAAIVMATRGLIAPIVWASQSLENWLVDHSMSPRVIVISRRLFGKGSTAARMAERANRHYEGAQYENCISTLTAAIDVDPSNAVLWNNRAGCHYAMENMQGTIDDASQALRLDSLLVESRRFRAYALISKKDWQAALEDLTKIPCNESGDAPYATWRGICHERLGHWGEATEDYRLALQLDPENVDAMGNLARIYSACPVDELRDGATAIVLATKACKRSEFKDWISVSILASAYAEFGDFKTALVYARRTLELAPAGEKSERAKRIEQFERGISYRLPIPATSVDNCEGESITQFAP